MILDQPSLWQTVALPIVLALLSGAAINAVIGALRYRHDARRAPAELDSLIVGSAEKAVLSLERALQAAEAEIADLRGRIATMQAEITVLHERLAQMGS